MAHLPHVAGGSTLLAAFARGWRQLRRRLDQQYLAKNPYGYRCHSATGVPFAEDA